MRKFEAILATSMAESKRARQAAASATAMTSYEPLGPDGQPTPGERVVNEVEADVIRRIVDKYAAGRSSRTIAFGLNTTSIAGPQGREWGPSTIHGNVQRRNGILNNELCVGRLGWNRQGYKKIWIPGSELHGSIQRPIG